MSTVLSRSQLPLLFAIALTALALSARPPEKPKGAGHVGPMLPRRELLYVLGKSNILLLADYFWVQTLQATGRARTDEEFRDIFDYAEMVSDLDPKFREVFVFAGAVIPVRKGRGVYANTRESTRILEKGLERAPDHVFLRILLAYNLSYFEKQPLRAARLLEETAKMPGAPRYLSALSTRLYAVAGDFDAGMALAESLAEAAPDESSRAAFLQRRKELLLERVLDEVDKASAAYTAREGHPPATVKDLVGAGDLSAVPPDPMGGELVLDPSGKASSTAQEKRLKLHDSEQEDAE